LAHRLVDVGLRQRAALGQPVEDSAKAIRKGFKHRSQPSISGAMPLLALHLHPRLVPDVGPARKNCQTPIAPAGATRWRTLASGVEMPQSAVHKVQALVESRRFL